MDHYLWLGCAVFLNKFKLDKCPNKSTVFINLNQVSTQHRLSLNSQEIINNHRCHQYGLKAPQCFKNPANCTLLHLKLNRQLNFTNSKLSKNKCRCYNKCNNSWCNSKMRLFNKALKRKFSRHLLYGKILPHFKIMDNLNKTLNLIMKMIIKK